jgi:hypothetical protein
LIPDETSYFASRLKNQSDTVTSARPKVKILSAIRFGLWGVAVSTRLSTDVPLQITQASWDNGIVHKAVLQYLRQIGSKGGSVTSPEKARSARENGKLGGRPRKQKVKR